MDQMSGTGGYMQYEGDERIALGTWNISRTGDNSWTGDAEITDGREIVQHPSGEFQFTFFAADGNLAGTANVGQNHSEVGKDPIFELAGTGLLRSTPRDDREQEMSRPEADATWDALGNTASK